MGTSGSLHSPASKPKRFMAGQNYATMTFLFNEGAKSFEKWRDALK